MYSQIQRDRTGPSQHPIRTLCVFLAALTLFGLPALVLAADGTAGSTVNSFIDAWFAISDAAKEAQPHWMTPVVTVTPRLEQEYRYDQTWQNRPGDTNVTNYGAGKGLEIIPTSNTEVILGQPSYVSSTTRKGTTQGFADETFLLKYRGLSENEENGNYIVTGFLGVSIPTGSNAFTNHHTIITPTLAGGKGWGTREWGFDIQSTAVSRFPPPGCGPWECRSRGTPHSRVIFWRSSGRKSKPPIPTSRTARTTASRNGPSPPA